MRAILEARLDAMDVATRLRLEGIEGIRPETQRQIDHLRELHAERFDSFDHQLIALREVIHGQIDALAQLAVERDKAIEQAHQESRMAVRAALASAKEAGAAQNEANTTANTKTETTFTKQIDALGAVVVAGNKALDDKIADLKSRLDSGEGRQGGARDDRTERRLDVGQVIAVIAVLLTMIGLLVVGFHK